MVNQNQLKKLCCEGNTQQEMFAWNMREFLARTNAIKIWGNGFTFETENNKLNKAFKRFANMNQLENLMGFIERNCSKYGRTVITLNKTKSGDIMLNIPNPFYFNGIGKVFVQPQLAVVWQKFVKDNKTFVVKSTYDVEKCVNEVYTIDEEKIRVFDRESEILKELQLEKVWNHNMGIVPVVEITNIPFFQFEFNNYDFVTITDWYPAYHFERLAWDTYKNLIKELYFCHSRIVFENANQELVNMVKQLERQIDLGEEVKLNDFILESEVGSQFKPMVGMGDFTKYTDTMNQIFDFYFKFAGNSRFSEGGGAQKTVAETSATRSSMIETMNQKINLRTKQVTDLLRKVFVALGLIKDYWDDNNEFNFKINGNLTKDDSAYIDNMLKLVDAGAMSVVDVIQDVFKLTKQDAQKRFEDIKKFNEENNIINPLMEMANQLDNEANNGSKISETGEHKDLANKRGEQ